MNKIYNNLSLENLMRTEWFNQFDSFQQDEIIRGLDDNLNVFIYAKDYFTWRQMLEIRKGLEANLDVSIYAKPKYPWREMEQIRLKLLKESTL